MKWVYYVELDRVLDVSLEEAFNGLIEVVKSDGLLIDLSAGAIAYEALKLIESDAIRGNVVAVFQTMELSI